MQFPVIGGLTYMYPAGALQTGGEGHPELDEELEEELDEEEEVVEELVHSQ